MRFTAAIINFFFEKFALTRKAKKYASDLSIIIAGVIFDIRSIAISMAIQNKTKAIDIQNTINMMPMNLYLGQEIIEVEDD